MSSQDSKAELLSHLPPKPLSSYAKGAGLTRRRLLGNIKWNLLRENFEISTWLAMGAALQCLLFALQISRLYAAGPALIFLVFKITYTLLMVARMIPNPRLNDAYSSVRMFTLPEGSANVNGEKRPFSGVPGSDEVCIVMIAASCRHPFGYLAPYYEFDKYTDIMILDLEKKAATNGFLGATGFVNTSTYTSGNEIMTLLYFRSKKDVDAFHATTKHMEGRIWRGKSMAKQKVDYIGLYQENYVSGKGQWDNFSENMVPTMIDATTFLVEGEDGTMRWEPVHAQILQGGPKFLKRKEIWKDAKHKEDGKKAV